MGQYTKYKGLLIGFAATFSLASSQPLLADNMTVDSKGGISVYDDSDTSYWFKIGGRLHLDTANFYSTPDSPTFPSGSQVRRARMTIKGGLASNWIYKLDVNYSDGGRASFGEAFMAYNGWEDYLVAVGQVGTPFSMAAWTGANATRFMENPLPVNAFAPPSGLGVYAEGHWEYFTLAGAVIHPRDGVNQTGDIIDPSISTTSRGPGPHSDPLGVVMRATFSPIHTEDRVLHFGASGHHQNVHNLANSVNFATGPEIIARSTPLFSSAIPNDSVKNYSVYGVEAAGLWGRWTLAGEYLFANVSRGEFASTDPRSPNTDLDLHGGYVALTCVLTGESKDYDYVSGSFGRVRPCSPKGAVELGLRHSYVKLGDENLKPTIGGITTNKDGVHSSTVGLTWWLNDNVRFLANYARMGLENNDLNIWGLRASANW